VLHAALVNENFDMGMLPHDGTRRTRMIEVDVCQQNLSNVWPSNAIRLQSQLECRQTGRWPGIDDGNSVVTLHKCGRNNLRPAVELEINP
jgi:hypothetical protein